ncbi:MAG: ribonuclease HII [Armatimonadota bacterium]
MAKPQGRGLGKTSLNGAMPGMWHYEREVWLGGFRLVAGIDEAGRGPLAGPVVAAAVILPSDFDPRGINDSKVLTAPQRESAYGRILANCHAIGIGVAGPEIIDQLNIYHATHFAMLLAVQDLDVQPEVCLVDGLPIKGLPMPHKAIVKGDSKSVSIAAASIIAKVTRDRLMADLDLEYPGYGFARHKGYATVEHLRALTHLGICPEHRKSFEPCKSVSLDPCLTLDTPEG